MSLIVGKLALKVLGLRPATNATISGDIALVRLWPVSDLPADWPAEFIIRDDSLDGFSKARKHLRPNWE